MVVSTTNVNCRLEYSKAKPGVLICEAISREPWIALFICVISCLYLHLFYDYTVLNADEGIVLQGAQRILEGQVLYRDFFSFYTPGSYYWLALLFRVFGNSILVARTALVLYGGIFSVLTYSLARRVCSRCSAIMTAGLVTLVCLPFRFLVLHNWDSTLLAYIALYSAVRFLETSQTVWALAVGSFSALTCLFEQSKGLGLCLGLGAGLVLITVFGQRPELWTCKRILALVAGLEWPFLLTLAYFGCRHTLRLMIADWLWPLDHYSVANTLPYGYLVLSTADRGALIAGSWTWRLFILVFSGPCFVLPALPILAFALLVFKVLRIWRARSVNSTDAYYVIVCSTISGLLIGLFATKRPDFTHILYLGPLFLLPLAWIIERKDGRFPTLRSLRPLMILYILVSFVTFGAASLWGPLEAHYTLTTRRGVLKTSSPDTALKYLQSFVPPGQTTFVYPYQPLYYYLSATHSPSRYEYLQPGLHSKEQFEESVLDLAKDKTRVLLFEPSFNDKIPLAFPSTPIRVLAQRDPVADYIAVHYRVCTPVDSATFWHFLAMSRRDLPCPNLSIAVRSAEQ